MSYHTLEDVLAAAKAQRGVLYCILANVASIFAPFAFPFFPLFAFPLVVCPFQIYFTFKLAKALKVRYLIPWVLGMFVPLLSFIMLVILNQNACRVIREAGFEVGTLGPRIEDIEQAVRQQVSVRGSDANYTRRR